MRKIIKTISLLILLIMISTLCFATNDTTDLEEEEETIDASQLLQQNFDYRIGDIYSLDGNDLKSNTIVYGNVYILGDKVDIDVGAVVGDLFVLGNNVYIKTMEVTGSMFILGQDVSINGLVDTSIYALAENLNITAKTNSLYGLAEKMKITENSIIGLDTRLFGEEIIFNGNAKSNLYTKASKLVLGDTSEVQGNIEYTNEISIPETIEESKLIKKENVEIDTSEIQSIASVIQSISIIISIITSIGVLILIGLLMPKSLKYETDLNKKIFIDMLVGLIGIIVIPILSIILIFTIFGAGIGLILLLLYFIVITIFAVPVTCIEISKLILGNGSNSKVKIVILAIGLRVLITILAPIQYVGIIVNLICVLYGFGFILRKSFSKKSNCTNTLEVKSEDSKSEEVTIEENNVKEIVSEVDEKSETEEKEVEEVDVINDDKTILEKEEPVITENENETDDPISSNDDENKE